MYVHRGRFGTIAPALLPAGVSLCLAAAALAASDVDAQIEKAWECSQRANRYSEGIEIAEKIVADAKATAAQKLSAFDVMLTIRGKQRRPADVGEVTRRMMAAFPDNAQAVAKAALAHADALWQTGKTRPEAAEVLEQALPKLAKDKKAAAAVHARLGKVLLDLQKNDRAYAESKAAFDSGALDDQAAAEALRNMADAAWQGNDYRRCEQALTRLLEPRYLQALNSWERAGQLDRYGEVLKRLKKHDEARAFYRKAVEAEEDPGRRQRYAILIGDIALDAGQYDQARQAYEQVFREDSASAQEWFQAQGKVVESLKAQGDFESALQAARICLDAAWDSSRLAEGIQMVAEMLQALDRHVGRANALILYQKHGPAGEDGKAGTGDDLTDPLADVGYPTFAEREKAFAAARRAAGDDAAASRFRAMTHLYCGKPRLALRAYLDALARSGMNDFGSIAQETVLVGVRAVQGHPHGLERFFEYLNHGPHGPDGKAGTDDDLADPFLSLAPKPSDRPAGAAAELADEDLRVLREARCVLRELAVNDVELSEVRHEAVRALVRVQAALNDWPDGADWYLEQFLLRPTDARHTQVWLGAAQQAAKGAAYHLGGVRAFWRKVDALHVPTGQRRNREFENLQKGLERAASQLQLRRSLVPGGLKTWHVDERKLDVSRLRTLPEEDRKR